MSKRPPIRRVSTRKAPPPAVSLQHQTEDDDALHDSDLEIPPLPDAKPPEEISMETKVPESNAPVAAQDQPKSEDFDSLTEDAGLTGSQAPGPDAENTTALPVNVGPSITTAVASMVARSSSTTATPSRMHRMKKSKEDLYREYMFGIDEQATIDATLKGQVPDESHGRFRLNRTYNMRMKCNAKRINLSRMVVVEETELSAHQDSEAAKRTLGFIPPNLFREPKIKVRPTLGSKFRYLYNRRPQGVKVYFKHAKMNPKDRPPFVAATKNC